MQQPKDGPKGPDTFSATAKRPAGVGDPGAPIPTGIRRTSRPPRRTSSSRRESEARSAHSTGWTDTSRPNSTQPWWPFGSASAVTFTQRPRTPTTPNTTGPPSGPRGPTLTRRGPFGRARSTTLLCTGLAASAAVAPCGGAAACEAAATAAAKYAINALPISRNSARVRVRDLNWFQLEETREFLGHDWRS